MVCVYQSNKVAQLIDNNSLIAMNLFTILFKVIMFTFVIWAGVYALAIYDRDINAQQKFNFFCDNIKQNKCEQNYSLLDERLSNLYTKDEFCAIFTNMLQSNNFLYEKTAISSSDNFNLRLSKQQDSTLLAIISFGGGWGKGWKVTNIQKIE